MTDKAVHFIYDRDCPVCTRTALALRIKKQFGKLHLINAREADSNHPLIREVNARGLDLDEGMVIIVDDHYYHGNEALKFMARHGKAQNAVMAFWKSLFWSDQISSLTYPWMRGTRNWMLHRKGAGRIDNLNLKSEPIFCSVFGESWNDLPPVLQKHYANRPYTDDELIVDGKLDIMCKGPIKLLGPILKLMGQIPARNEKEVPVTVRFKSDPDSKAFHFLRIFSFRNHTPYKFNSRMQQIRDNEVVEIMSFGLGWKVCFLWDGEKIIMKHSGYALKLFGHLIPLPLNLLMGKGYAEEKAIDENTFEMMTHITHSWWGKVYEYKGRFKIRAAPDSHPAQP